MESNRQVLFLQKNHCMYLMFRPYNDFSAGTAPDDSIPFFAIFAKIV
jgi:hypothetical protein